MARIDLAGLKRYKSWHVMAVNCTWQLVPWADVLYAGDREWWSNYGGGMTFAGDRYTRNEWASVWFHAKHVRSCPDNALCNTVHRCTGQGLCRIPNTIHLGGNSGYQAINLAYHLGARSIVLLGFDMHREGGAHWHGDHPGLNVPEVHLPVWRDRMAPLANDLRREGVKVVNATPGTALECFPKMDLARALR